ncbi:MAG: helix-turn-helix transcriptional regulator, partial [Candidatus Dormiibacterota bacterium]
WQRARRHHERERQTVLDSLTPRELQVLGLLSDGAITTAIAAKLYISPVTVKTHIRSLLAKLDVHSQLQAVARAQTLGIVPSSGVVPAQSD